MPCRFVSCLALLAGAAIFLSSTQDPASPPSRRPRLPVYFIANQGQLDSQVAFYVQGRHSAAYFTPSAVYYRLTEPKPIRAVSGESAVEARVRLQFLDANPRPAIEPLDRTGATVSYFRGPREQWKTGLPTYAAVLYRDLWPGIDLEFGGQQGFLKYTFHVRPGADPRRIRLAYQGASGVRLTASGSLAIETPAGGFTDERPVAWQDTPAGRQAVTAAFQLDGEQVRFHLGPYDATQPLTLDPVVLLYAGFLGGADIDSGNGIAVDAAGNAYVIGHTHSTDFPVTVGPDLANNADYDVFVAKVNAAGTALLYAGFLGGSDGDYGAGIAVDGAGNAYLTGRTSSTTFPVTVGPDFTYNGDTDAFVAKVNATGTALVYAGFLGGSQFDAGSAIAVDAAGNAYVTGRTSSGHPFPSFTGPGREYRGGMDAFAAKVDATGLILNYVGYIGGSGYDAGNGIAVDPAGNAYITGESNSASFRFDPCFVFDFECSPTPIGPDTTNNGGMDAFVTKVHATGSFLVYAKFIGGSSDDYASSVAVDGAGNAYVTGAALSSENMTFPVAVGPDLTYNGGGDAFVAKVSANGRDFAYAGYLGGSGYEEGRGIAVDAAGNAYITGATLSTQSTFPVATGPDLTHNGGSDAFVAKLNATGTALVYSGFLGGSADDEGRGIAVDAAGSALITGATASSQTTFPVTVGPGLTYNGASHSDAFAARINSYPSTAGPVFALRNGFNAIETGTLPSPTLRNAGGNFRLNPALSLSPSGHAYLTGRDSAAGVWINVLNLDETYSGWLFAGGNSPGQPALAVAGEIAWIAVRDPWNSYSVRPYNRTTGFGVWTWLQGVLATDPQIAGCPNGDVYITGKDNWNGIWTRRYSTSLAGWQSWRFVGGIITGAPAIACGSDNAAYIAVRDPSNNMWLARVFQESPATWSYGEGILQGDLQVTASGSRILCRRPRLGRSLVPHLADRRRLVPLDVPRRPSLPLRHRHLWRPGFPGWTGWLRPPLVVDQPWEFVDALG